MYWILFIGIAVISYLVQANLKNKFEKYSKMPLMNGMTGRDVAIKMLHDNRSEEHTSELQSHC